MDDLHARQLRNVDCGLRIAELHRKVEHNLALEIHNPQSREPQVSVQHTLCMGGDTEHGFGTKAARRAQALPQRLIFE